MHVYQYIWRKKLRDKVEREKDKGKHKNYRTIVIIIKFPTLQFGRWNCLTVTLFWSVLIESIPAACLFSVIKATDFHFPKGSLSFEILVHEVCMHFLLNSLKHTNKQKYSDIIMQKEKIDAPNYLIKSIKALASGAQW